MSYQLKNLSFVANILDDEKYSKLAYYYGNYLDTEYNRQDDIFIIGQTLLNSNLISYYVKTNEMIKKDFKLIQASEVTLNCFDVFSLLKEILESSYYHNNYLNSVAGQYLVNTLKMALTTISDYQCYDELQSSKTLYMYSDNYLVNEILWQIEAQLSVHDKVATGHLMFNALNDKHPFLIRDNVPSLFNNPFETLSIVIRLFEKSRDKVLNLQGELKQSPFIIAIWALLNKINRNQRKYRKQLNHIV